MQGLDPGVLAAIITSISGLVVGVTALRKAGADAKKSNADTAGVIVDGAGDVVKLLREQLEEQQRQQEQMGQRLMNLEVVVGSWEGWAERVLTILDRALAMLEEDQRRKLQPDVDEVVKDRPKHIHGGPPLRPPPKPKT